MARTDPAASRANALAFQKSIRLSSQQTRITGPASTTKSVRKKMDASSSAKPEASRRLSKIRNREANTIKLASESEVSSRPNSVKGGLIISSNAMAEPNQAPA